MMLITKSFHLIFVSHTIHFYLESISPVGAYGQIQFLLFFRSRTVDISNSFWCYRIMCHTYFRSLLMLRPTYMVKSNTVSHCSIENNLIIANRRFWLLDIISHGCTLENFLKSKQDEVFFVSEVIMHTFHSNLLPFLAYSFKNNEWAFSFP